jgi:hypothetical protein
MPNPLRFAFNEPVLLSLEDPQGQYDFDTHQGMYRTTQGQSFTLPRAAVILLNQLDPRPGEELQITRYWKGPGHPIEWTVCLSPRTEQSRAAEEMAADDAQEPSDLSEALKGSIAQVEARKPVSGPPTLVKKGAKREIEPQPRGFNRGNGTEGPAPQPAPPIPATRPAAVAPPVKTPYPDMLRHIVRTVKQVLAQEKLQLGDGPTQDLISTVYIDAAKRSGILYDFSDGGPA